MAKWRSLRYPWNAAIGPGSYPERFYVQLINEALHFGLPARRRPGMAWAWTARHGIPPMIGVAALAVIPRRHRPDLDECLLAIRSHWKELAAAAKALPLTPPPLTALALERSAGATLFVFGDRPEPLLVVRVAEGKAHGVRTETAALLEARAAGVAPRSLGVFDRLHVQEGVPGSPLRIAPLEPGGGPDLDWPQAYSQLTMALEKLAAATVKTGFPDEIRPAVERALAADLLDARTNRAVSRAWRSLAGLDVSVLRHHDTSVQNCLFTDDRRLSAIVDWEMAVPLGAPGFDMWNAALSFTEHGVGLARWSEDLVVATFAGAFTESSFWSRARHAARATLTAAGIADEFHNALEVVFFASRVGDRLAPRIDYPIGPCAAVAMLRTVCTA